MHPHSDRNQIHFPFGRQRTCFPQKIAFVVIACLFLVPVVDAQPVLKDLAPRGLIAGTATKITLQGDHLTDAISVWMSCPAKIEKIVVAKDGKSATCIVTVEKKCLPQVVGLIAANEQGITDPLFAMVDDLPSIQDNGSNHDPEKGQAVHLPTSIDGKCDGVHSDFYRFHVRKQQRVAFEIFSQRLASSMDPVMRLIDPQGREMAMADDDLGIGADCRFEFVSQIDGEYKLEVRDNRYQAGGIYRLRIADFPIVTSPFPLGGRMGATTKFRFISPYDRSLQPTIQQITCNETFGRIPIVARVDGGSSSALAQFVVSDLPELIESEQSGRPTALTIPCAVSGVLFTEKEKDLYQFALATGQHIAFTGQGRSHGSPTYLSMRLLNAKQEIVATTPVNDQEESTLNYTAPADGIYQLVVNDLLHRGGRSFAYRLLLQSGPDFALRLKHDDQTKTKFHLPVGQGAIPLTVQVQRKSFHGEIRLEFQEPNSNFKIYGGLISAGTNEVRIFLVPTGSKAGVFQPIRLVGVAESRGRRIRRPVRTEPTLRAKYPQLLYPYPWLDGLLTSTISQGGTRFFEIKSEQNSLKLVRGDGAEHLFSIERKNKEFKSAVQVFAKKVPTRCQAVVKSEKDKYAVQIKTQKRAQVGEFDLCLIAIGDHNGNAQYIEYNLPIHIVASQ